MSDLYLQSSINEVRDQLSLDFADGKYLNVLSANLGMVRPVFGFSDSTWRALVKVLALKEKQVATKFEDALAILFGPRHTVVTTLAADAVTGDVFIDLTNTDRFPQLGTIVLDRGLPTEETVDYDFIDRTTNRAHLTTALSNSHTAITSGSTTVLVTTTTSDTTIYVASSNLYPGSGSIPILFQDHTGVDTYAVVTAASSTVNTLTVSSAIGTVLEDPTPEHVHSTLLVDYPFPSEFLKVVDNDKFHDHGFLLIGDSSAIATVSGTTSSVTAAAGTFTADKHVGYLAQFAGDVTFGIAGERVSIIANTDTTLTFQGTLSSAPAAGDSFYVLPIVEYDKNDDSTTELRLRKPIYDLTLSAGSYVEELGKLTTATVGQVQVVGSNWDVIQSNPRLVELLLPEAVQDVNTIRSASYIHDAYQTVSTTLTSATAIGDTLLPVNATAFPVAGQVVVDSGGVNEEYIGYKRAVITDDYVLAGSTTTSINTTNAGYPALIDGANTVIYIEDKSQGISYSTAQFTAGGTSTVTLTYPLPNILFSKLSEETTKIWFHDVDNLTVVNRTLAKSHQILDPVDYYNVAVSSTLQDGVVWPTGTNRFPAPYVYDITSNSTEGATFSTTLTDLVSGPTSLVLGTLSGGTALEVLDATAMPLSTTFSVSIGIGTTSIETTTVSSVHLKQRTIATVQVGSIIGDTILDLNSLGTVAGGGIPLAINYRVIVDRGGPNEEVVYVRSVDAATAKLTVDPMTIAHGASESVELLADILVVSSLSQVHGGYVSYSDRVTRWPTYDWVNTPTRISPIYTSISLTTSAGLSSTGGTVILSYADNNRDISSILSSNVAVSDTTLVLDSTADFPIVYPYEIIISVGRFVEERAIVSNNDTGTNTLTLNSSIAGVRNAHTVGNKVQVVPSSKEVLEYTSTSPTSLGFSPGIMLNSTHRPAETVLRSSGLSVPRDQGYDFPLRMPSDLLTRLQYVIDLIRAAGIQVKIIESR